MTYSPTIYDWRPTVQPKSQVFLAGGQALDGGMTLGGASVESPEPGGRSELRLEFDRFANADTNLDASWLASRMLNGAAFRIRLWQPSVQLIADALLGGSTDLGVNWSNDMGWSGNVGWAFDPTVSINRGGAKGSTVVRINTSSLGQYVKIGHVVGFHIDGYDFAHKVVNLTVPQANRADITIEPPLRRRVTASDRLKLRPIMTASCVNAREVAGNFLYGTSMTFNPARFVEVLV